MTDSIGFIPVTEYELIDKSIIIGLASKGIFKFEDLINMEYKKFEYIYNKCKDIVKKLYSSKEEK